MEKYKIYDKKEKKEFFLEAKETWYICDSEKISCKEAEILLAIFKGEEPMGLYNNYNKKRYKVTRV